MKNIQNVLWVNEKNDNNQPTKRTKKKQLKYNTDVCVCAGCEMKWEKFFVCFCQFTKQTKPERYFEWNKKWNGKNPISESHSLSRYILSEIEI